MGVFNALGGSMALNGYAADRQCRSKPSIGPGQIWLVECESASLSAFHITLLTHANVVLYDRALSAAVARVLPIGAYAEPLAATTMSGPAIAARALLFAAEGWSVLQLVEMRPDWRRRLRFATEEMKEPGDKSPLLAIGTIAADRYRPIRDRQQHGAPAPADIAIIAAELRSDELLSLTFGVPGASPGLRPPTQGQVFTANGLAG
jgi:hypothetical protein